MTKKKGQNSLAEQIETLIETQNVARTSSDNIQSRAEYNSSGSYYIEFMQ